MKILSPIEASFNTNNQVPISEAFLTNEYHQGPEGCLHKVVKIRENGPSLRKNCLVCGDHATVYHYNALSCQSCKIFFRRSIIKGSSKTCKYMGGCQITMSARKCQSCRLKKCYAIGMLSKYVVPVYKPLLLGL